MTRPLTVAQAAREGERLLAASGVPSARLEAEVLLAHSLGTRRDLLPARFREAVPLASLERFRGLLARRRDQRTPVQYLTGIQEFYSLEFRVDRRVLIPRPETEMLVDELLAFREEEQRAGRAVSLIADVGTGSGCVAIAAASCCPELRVLASDISEEALRLASANGRAHQVEGRVALLAGDLLEPLAASLRLDAILCNPPYVAEGELPGLQVEVRGHEPLRALISGPSGLEVYERLLPQAAGRLRPGGLLALELAAGRHDPVREMLSYGPWTDVASRHDFQGFPRVLAARSRAVR